jgi:hypothetical protein
VNKNLHPNFDIKRADFRTFLGVWKSAIFLIFSRMSAEKRLSNAVRCAFIGFFDDVTVNIGGGGNLRVTEPL